MTQPPARRRARRKRVAPLGLRPRGCPAPRPQRAQRLGGLLNRLARRSRQVRRGERCTRARRLALRAEAPQLAEALGIARPHRLPSARHPLRNPRACLSWGWNGLCEGRSHERGGHGLNHRCARLSRRHQRRDGGGVHRCEAQQPRCGIICEALHETSLLVEGPHVVP